MCRRQAHGDRLHAHEHCTEVLVGSNTRDAQGSRRGADAHAKAWADRVGIDTTGRTGPDGTRQEGTRRDATRHDRTGLDADRNC